MYVADSGAAAEARGALRPGPRSAPIGPVVFALGAVSLITDVSAEMVTAVLPLYLVAGLGLSPLGFGVLDGVYNGFSAVVRLAGGHLADRGGRHKTVAAIGYGMSAVCKPLLLVAHSLPLIGAVLAADRTGKGLRTAPRDALISLSSAPAAHGHAFGVHRAMDTAGALTGPLVAFVILRQAAEGYDAVFTVSTCVAVTGVLVLLLFVPSRPRGGAEVRAPRVSLRAALALLRGRDLRRLAICALLLGLATVSDSFVYLVIQRRFAVPVQWFALLPLGTAAGFLALTVPLGRLADRVGRWRVFLGGHVALLAAYGLLLLPAHGGAVPYVVLGLHGAFYAATDGVLMAAAAATVPPGLRSSGLALVQTGQAGARFACSIAFGAAWTAWGDHTALTVAALALTACVACTAWLRPAEPVRAGA